MTLSHSPCASHNSLGDPFAAFELLGCGVLARDSSEKIRFANRRLLGWTGYTASELIDQPLTVLIPPELDQLCHAELRAVASGDLRARLTVLRRKDRTSFPVIAVPQASSEPCMDGIYLATIIDVASIETAKPANSPHTRGLRGSLERISREMQILSLFADAAGTLEMPLHDERLSRLSKREREVLAQLLLGYRVPAIAQSLYLSPHTVRSHLKSIFRQLGVRSQSGAIALVRSLSGDSGLPNGYVEPHTEPQRREDFVRGER